MNSNKLVNLFFVSLLILIFDFGLYAQDEHHNDANYTVMIKFTQRSPHFDNPQATLKVVKPDNSIKTTTINEVRGKKSDTERLLKTELDEWIDKGYVIENTSILTPDNTYSVMYFYLVYGGIKKSD